MPNRYSPLPVAFLALMLFSPAATAQTHQNVSPAPVSTPLVLQPSDGEARMRRPPPASLSTLAAPFLIKVDELNGGAKDFVIFTEDVPVGQTISPHRHPHSEEILFIHAGTATAWLDGKEAKVGRRGEALPAGWAASTGRGTRAAARPLVGSRASRPYPRHARRALMKSGPEGSSHRAAFLNAPVVVARGRIQRDPACHYGGARSLDRFLGFARRY